MSLPAQILQGPLVSFSESTCASPRLQVFGSLSFLWPHLLWPCTCSLKTLFHWVFWFCLKQARHPPFSDYFYFTSLSCWSAILSDISILFAGFFQVFIPTQSSQWGSLLPTIQYGTVNPHPCCTWLFTYDMRYVFSFVCVCLCMACISNICFRKSQTSIFKWPKT